MPTAFDQDQAAVGSEEGGPTLEDLCGGGQRLQQVPAQEDVEGRGAERGVCRIHDEKRGTRPLGLCLVSCPADHRGREVYAGDGVAEFGEQDTQRAGAAAQVQHTGGRLRQVGLQEVRPRPADLRLPQPVVGLGIEVRRSGVPFRPGNRELGGLREVI